MKVAAKAWVTSIGSVAVIVEGADVGLAYEMDGDGVPVTLLHGFTQSRRSWSEVRSMMPAGYRWVAPDLRGHGETRTSPGAPCTMEACTSDLELLWDHLGIERTHLVGYSMGGRLALHVAARRPGRLLSLLTVGAHAGLDGPARQTRRQEDDALARRIEEHGIPAFVDYWGGLPLFAGLQRRGPEFVAQIREQRLQNQASGLACSLRGMGAGAMQPVWEDLAGAGFPSTFVAGELDERYVAYAGRLAAAVPGGRFEIVAGAGHPVHQEKPAEFAGLLAGHLAAATAAASASSSTVD
jgi:2-succinyl-6-hydroxy-2,4-cyclohexadiene-1-carboxylate synthase